MVRHKDMPTGSRQWAGSVDEALDKVGQLEAIVQRVTKDLRLDYSDPNRQYNSGNVPSVQKPVQMKMSSMNDIHVPNVQDGDVLTWDGLKGRWVAGRYDGPAKPTNYGQNSGVNPDDPIDPEPSGDLIWSTQSTVENIYPDPNFVSGIGNWTNDNISNITSISLGTADLEWDTSVSYDGVGGSLKVTVHAPAQSDNGLNDGGIVRLYCPVPRSVMYVGYRIMAPEGIWHPSGSWATGLLWFDSATKKQIGGGGYQYTRGGGKGAGVWEYGFNPNYSYVDPNHDVYMFIELHRMYDGDTFTFYLDTLYLSGSYPPVAEHHFTGDDPDTDNYKYSWEGEPYNSTSKAEMPRRIGVPVTIPIGSTIIVRGEGFAPGEEVTVAHNDYWENPNNPDDYVNIENIAVGIADGSGNFEAEMAIHPLTTPGEATVSVRSGISPRPSVRPTFE